MGSSAVLENLRDEVMATSFAKFRSQTKKPKENGPPVETKAPLVPPTQKPDRADGKIHLTRLHLEASDLPRKYWEASLARVPDSLAYKAKIERYIRKMNELIPKGKGLLLHGPNRRGKTSIAAILLKEAIRCRFDAHFIRGADLIDATFKHRMIDDDTSVIDVIRDVDLLVIDDVGKSIIESRTGSLEAVFDNTLRARESELKATIITTNLPQRDQVEVFKPSMVELMKECMFPILVDGHSFMEEERTTLSDALAED